VHLHPHVFLQLPYLLAPDLLQVEFVLVPDRLSLLLFWLAEYYLADPLHVLLRQGVDAAGQLLLLLYANVLCLHDVLGDELFLLLCLFQCQLGLLLLLLQQFALSFLFLFHQLFLNFFLLKSFLLKPLPLLLLLPFQLLVVGGFRLRACNPPEILFEIVCKFEELFICLIENVRVLDHEVDVSVEFLRSVVLGGFEFLFYG
jgi:hypothetical protein